MVIASTPFVLPESKRLKKRVIPHTHATLGAFATLRFEKSKHAALVGIISGNSCETTLPAIATSAWGNSFVAFSQ